jgi:hypothetical protein
MAFTHWADTLLGATYLLDDVVHDVQVVDSFITQRGAYARKLREPAVNKDFGLEQRI